MKASPPLDKYVAAALTTVYRLLGNAMTSRHVGTYDLLQTLGENEA